MGKKALYLKYSEFAPVIMELAGIKRGHGDQVQLAEALGIKPQSITKFINKDQLPTDRVLLFWVKNNLPMGKFEELIGEKTTDGHGHADWHPKKTGERPDGVLPTVKVPAKEERPAALEPGEQSVAIPYGLATWKDHDSADRYMVMLEVLRSWVRQLFSERTLGGLVAWIVDSDNMEPTLPRDSLVLIDSTQTNIGAAGIYAFQSNGNFALRRLYPRLDGNVDVVNDNKAYPSINVPPTSLTESPHMKIVGRVVFCGNKI